MPPPIVPAPTIATRSIGRGGGVTAETRNLRRRCARRRRQMHERLGLFGADALGEDLPLAAAAVRRTAGSPPLQSPRPRAAARSAAASILPASCRAAAKSGALASAVPSRSTRSRVFVATATACGRPRERHGARQQVAVDDRVDQARLEGGRRRDRLAGHVSSSAFSIPTSRGSRCVPSAPGNDAEVHLGLAHAARRARRRGSDRPSPVRGRRRAPCRGSP